MFLISSWSKWEWATGTDRRWHDGWWLMADGFHLEFYKLPTKIWSVQVTVFFIVCSSSPRHAVLGWSTLWNELPMFCLDSKQTEVGLNWQQGMTPQRIKVQLVQATALSPHSKAIIICDQCLPTSKYGRKGWRSMYRSSQLAAPWQKEQIVWIWWATP